MAESGPSGSGTPSASSTSELPDLDDTDRLPCFTTGMPQEVLSQWDLWSERIRKVPTNAIDPAGGFPSYVTPDDNEQKWKNYLKNPTIPKTRARRI